MLLEQSYQFLLEGPLTMMIFLIADVPNHSTFFRLAYAKNLIHALTDVATNYQPFRL